MPSNAANIRPYQSTAGQPHPDTFKRSDTLVIDIHGHILTEGVDEEVRKHVPAERLDAVKFAGELTRELNQKQGRERREELIGVEKRLARSEEHTSELQSLMRNSYAVFCLKKKTKTY